MVATKKLAPRAAIRGKAATAITAKPAAPVVAKKSTSASTKAAASRIVERKKAPSKAASVLREVKANSRQISKGLDKILARLA